MPTEVAFPNSGKYELQETKSKEEMARYEEIGMWKDTVCYEKLPVTQDAAEYEELDIPNVDGDYQEICISNDALRYQETSLLKKTGQKWIWQQKHTQQQGNVLNNFFYAL